MNFPIEISMRYETFMEDFQASYSQKNTMGEK
jgi:hypothetical protein